MKVFENEYEDYLKRRMKRMFEEHQMIFVFQKMAVPKFTYKEQLAIVKREGFEIQKHHVRLLR